MLAARQHGVASRAQLTELGLSADAINRRIRAGRLHPVHRGVFAVGHPRITTWGRWMAALLACGPEAVLSHQTAASLWGLLAASRSTIDVTVPGRRRRRRPGIRLHQPRALDAADRTFREGFRVTTVARTLLDLAAVVDPPTLRRAFEEADRLGYLDLVELRGVRSRAGGRPGLRALDSLLDAALEPPDVRSDLERRFVELCRRYRLPPPALNVLVAGHVVDAVWPDARLVVELDGYAFHRSRGAFERDRRRDADLQLAGYDVWRPTFRRLKDEPATVASEIRTMLDRAYNGPTAPA